MTPEQRVVSWSRTVVGKAFEWGRTDCGMLTLQALQTMTGHGFADAYRGAWKTQEEALAHYDREKPSEVLQRFGAVPVMTSFVVLGDVITIPAWPWPEQMHFVLGRHSFVSDQKRGVVLVPTRPLLKIEGARAWRMALCPKPSP